MKDKDIIKALECCSEKICKQCPAYTVEDIECSEKTIKKALELITREQAEIERLQSINQAKLDTIHDLQAEIERLNKTKIETDDFCRRLCRMRMLNGSAIASYEDLQNYIQEEKSGAIKEFANKLKNKIKTECNPYGKPTFDYDTSIAIMRYIDNLAKEIVSEK